MSEDYLTSKFEIKAPLKDKLLSKNAPALLNDPILLQDAIDQATNR